MQHSRYLLILVTAASFLNLQAQQKPESSKKQTAAPPAKDAKPSKENGVDAGKVTGSTFESQYFKFTLDLPKDWKALDDSVRMKANAVLLQQDAESARVRAVASSKKNAAKGQTAAASTSAAQNPSPTPTPDSTPENYSLMVASPDGVDSLASPVLPRINIWANKKIPPLDNPKDHIQFLLAGRRTQMLVRPQDVTFDGHAFVRASVITPSGEYYSEYVTEIGNYLVGFDFRAQSERELVEATETMKSLKFQ